MRGVEHMKDIQMVLYVMQAYQLEMKGQPDTTRRQLLSEARELIFNREMNNDEKVEWVMNQMKRGHVQ